MWAGTNCLMIIILVLVVLFALCDSLRMSLSFYFFWICCYINCSCCINFNPCFGSTGEAKKNNRLTFYHSEVHGYAVRKHYAMKCPANDNSRWVNEEREGQNVVCEAVLSDFLPCLSTALYRIRKAWKTQTPCAPSCGQNTVANWPMSNLVNM